VGSAQVLQAAEPATLRITDQGEEIGVGDRLLVAEAADPLQVAPHAPAPGFRGRIIGLHRGLDQAGRHHVVALDQGSKAGVERGHVLRIDQAGAVIRDRETEQMVTLPDLRIGLLLVVSVYADIAYGLILNAQQPVRIGARVGEP
jgi:hypothetical protein